MVLWVEVEVDDGALGLNDVLGRKSLAVLAHFNGDAAVPTLRESVVRRASLGLIFGRCLEIVKGVAFFRAGSHRQLR